MTELANMHQRLAPLPNKVAAPFRSLLERGQIDESDLSAILDAGDITGDPSRLLAFAVSYFSLRQKCVPIDDTIRMAKRLGGRINFGWSAKRWKAEHDRFARIETLRRLAGENESYNVSAFEEMLPKRVAGRLIRTSRRLGLEGLRQRHCVASYHDQLKSGNCGILSLILDGRRWTVEVRPTGDGEAPLLIGQIKTRYNTSAPGEIRNQVHDLLGIPMPKPTVPHATDGSQETSFYLETLRALLPVLQQHGIRRVIVTFDGHGDSGSIYDVIAEGGDADLNAIHMSYTKTERVFENGVWIEAPATRERPLKEVIEDLSLNWLDETNVDWYNNDGGYGDLVIDVNAGTVCLEVNVRFTESDNAYYQTKDIQTGLETD